MTTETPTPPRAGAALRTSLRANLRRPLSTLLLLSLFVTVASGTIGDATETGFLMALVLLVVETYVEIAVVLAAAEAEPEPSGDHWVRAAFRARTFWRFILTSITVFFVTALGFLFLIVPGLYLAGRLGLSQSAAVLERRIPSTAMSRSTELSAPARGTIAVLFGLISVAPAMALQALAYAGAEVADGILIPVSIASVLLGRLALVALTQTFVALAAAAETEGDSGSGRDPDPEIGSPPPGF